MKALTIPNVLSIVGMNGRPSIISDEEISSIRRGIETEGVHPHLPVTGGVRVVITSGSLSGMEGTFLCHLNSRQKSRILISVNSISQAFVVEVANESIQPVGGKITPKPANNQKIEIAS